MNQQILLKSKPIGKPTSDNFEIVATTAELTKEDY
jgi:hypothetical protein